MTRVLSSPYPRCVQTVEPLARLAWVWRWNHSRALAEGVPTGAASFALMMSALAGTDAVLCSHGDVIPEVIRLLRITGTVINGQRGNAKGSIWTVTSDGESLLTAEYAKTPRKPDAVLR